MAAGETTQLAQAGALARRGQHRQAHELLTRLVTVEPANGSAWAWLAYVAPTTEEKRIGLYKALELKPDDERILAAFQRFTGPPQTRQAAVDGVFISYARPDELFAVELMESLQNAGIQAWMDMTEVSDDTNWHSAIARALRSCGLMVLVMSPAALESEDITLERDWFLNTGKIIIPVLHRTCDTDQLYPYQAPIDFRQDYARGVEHLIDLLTPQPTQHG